jgi:hypothetical protein
MPQTLNPHVRAYREYESMCMQTYMHMYMYMYTYIYRYICKLHMQPVGIHMLQEPTQIHQYTYMHIYM